MEKQKHVGPKFTPVNQAKFDEVAQRFLAMHQALKRLIESAKAKELRKELFRVAVDILETLPLSTAEFCLALSRVNNALLYTITAEFGAALFELRLILRQINVYTAAFHVDVIIM